MNCLCGSLVDWPKTRLGRKTPESAIGNQHCYPASTFLRPHFHVHPYIPCYFSTTTHSSISSATQFACHFRQVVRYPGEYLTNPQNLNVSKVRIPNSHPVQVRKKPTMDLSAPDPRQPVPDNRTAELYLSGLTQASGQTPHRRWSKRLTTTGPERW